MDGPDDKALAVAGLLRRRRQPGPLGRSAAAPLGRSGRDPLGGPAGTHPAPPRAGMPAALPVDLPAGRHDGPSELGPSAAVAAVIQRWGADQGNLIEVLHAIQPIEGHLSRRALHQVACALGLPLSRVYGVASFYHLFRLRPAARHRIAVCCGTACFVNGAPRLRARLAERLGLAGPEGRCGDWELAAGGCLSACGSLPVLQLDGGAALAMPLEPEALLVARLEALGVPLAPGQPVAAGRSGHGSAGHGAVGHGTVGPSAAGSR
jgi:NADH:ubiquinone oxidoreductase subunit E